MDYTQLKEARIFNIFIVVTVYKDNRIDIHKQHALIVILCISVPYETFFFQCLSFKLSFHHSSYLLQNRRHLVVDCDMDLAFVSTINLGLFMLLSTHSIWIPQWLSGKGSTCQREDVGSIPGSGRCPGEGHGNPLQYSCLGNPMNRGAWQAIVQGVTRVRHNLGT